MSRMSKCAQKQMYRLVLLAWSAVLVAGAALAWKFISERGFDLPAIPGTEYDKEEQSYLDFFGDGVDGARAALVLGDDFPLMAMTNTSTCQIMPALQQLGSTFQIQLSCQNESAAGGGCITSSQLRSEVYSLVKIFMSSLMSPENLSHFLELQVGPMLEAAPEILACPQVEDTMESLAKASFQVEESLGQKMPHCDLSVLSFWSLPAQQFQRNLTFADFKFEVTLKLPAGSFWHLFQNLLSSKSQKQVMVAVQANTCNGLPVGDFSHEALQVANILKDVAEHAEAISSLKTEVMSFAIIVETIRNGVEVVMAISTGTLPLGIAVLAYMVGNTRLVIIAVINVLAAVTGSVLVMECLVTHLMPVSIFTPPFLIAVVLSMSIDYALFLLSRFQKETAAGATAADGMAVAMATSGRIVVQAGVILACCFACLLMMPVELLRAMGAGGLVAVAVAMTANLTLTPALILGTWPAFWISKPNGCCRQAPKSEDVEAPGEELNVSNFWQRFGERLMSCAKPVLCLILLSAAPCIWKDAAMPASERMGFMPALPQGSSTAKILHSIGEEFGYEVLFPTTIGLLAPADVGRDEWRHQACQSLQEIGEEVYGNDFTSSKFMSEVIIDGKCLAVDVAGSLLKWWQTNAQDGTVDGTIAYINYPLNPLSIDGQRWTHSLQRAVEDHHVGTWFVHGYGPLLSSQSGEIHMFFPYLLLATVGAVLLISTCFTRSVLWSLRALLSLFWMSAVLWCLSSLAFPEGLYYIVPAMMLPFVVGVALDYDIFYTEAVLEECTAGLSVPEAGIAALGKTANIITAAGVVMIIAFSPLLLSSTLVLKQIGFVAIGGLSISAFWNTKIAMPVCLHFFGKYSFWPRKFHGKRRDAPIDAIFLAHPANLVDTFTWLTSPDTEKPWTPSWWMYLFLPVLWLIGFVGAHVLRRLGLPNHVVLEDYEYNGLHVQTWIVVHYGRHFRNSLERHDARRNLRAAARRAEKTGARVLGLGALNKAEALNRGGLDLIQDLPSSRGMAVTHGDHLTAAAVVENVLRLVARFPDQKVFMTGATGKTGKAVALALLRRGVSVMCHSGSKERRDELETHGLATASQLRDGADCGMWIVGKYDQLVNEVMPPSAVASVFAVPDPVSRSDVMVFAGATMQIDESRLKGQRANLKLLRQEIYACNAATLLLASSSRPLDDLGEVDPLRLETYLEGAESIGITLKPLEDLRSKSR